MTEFDASAAKTGELVRRAVGFACTSTSYDVEQPRDLGDDCPRDDCDG